MSLDFQILAQSFSGRVLNTIAEGLALAGLSWLALRLSGAATAVARFAVWFSTLIVVAAMPFLMRNGSAGVLHVTSFELSSSWAWYFFITWAAIASVLLARLALSVRHMWKVRAQCTEIDSDQRPQLIETITRCCGRRKVRLVISDSVRVPTALGFFRPAVVLPAWTLDQLSPEELNSVLLHELAHLRRFDDWTNLAQKILKAIFFFHPAVWFIESRLALEREIACDDFVLQQTANAGSYAASLISLAEKALGHNASIGRALVLAQNALGRVKQMSLRVAEILRPKQPASKPWRQIVAAGSVLAVALIATPYAPEMVSFHSEALGNSAIAQPAAIAFHVPAIRASFRTPVQATRAAKRVPAIVPAKAKLRHVRDPKLVLTKAKAGQPIEPTLLLFRSSDLDRFGSPAWSFAIWRVTYESNGTTHVETIVMSSI